MMTRAKGLLVGLVRLYLLFAVIGRFVERMGAAECGCGDDCWCKRPGLSLFRWVFPFRHRCRAALDHKGPRPPNNQPALAQRLAGQGSSLLDLTETRERP
jgi:hypothetical protein